MPFCRGEVKQRCPCDNTDKTRASSSQLKVLRMGACQFYEINCGRKALNLNDTKKNDKDWQLTIKRFIALGIEIQVIRDLGSIITRSLADTTNVKTILNEHILPSRGPLTRYPKLRVAHATGMSGAFSPPPRINDPDMHHDTCVTYVSWCMPGSLTSGLLWCCWRRKCSRHSRSMRNPQCCVFGKRHMPEDVKGLRSSSMKPMHR